MNNNRSVRIFMMPQQSSCEEVPLKIVSVIRRYFPVWIVLSICLLLMVGCTSTAPRTPDNNQSNLDLASIPLEQALSSGLPTIAEFGRGVCVPCKQMKPILEELATEYEGKLNVVIVEVDDHMDQVRQYGIMAIPTQIVFDSKGKEIMRHIGFWPKEEIIAQLEKMGIE